MSTYFEVTCARCGILFVTDPDSVDRIVNCPKGHGTFVRAADDATVAAFHADVRRTLFGVVDNEDPAGDDKA